MSGTAIRTFDRSAVAAALPMGELISALRDEFAGESDVPARHHHRVSESDTTLLLMPAWRRGEHIGVKLVNVEPGNAVLGLPAVQAAYLLADYRTGRWLALMDGNELTARRTAAASALAASYLARLDASTLLVVGAGRVASLLAEAHSAVRPIRRVLVWARRPEAARQLAADLVRSGFPASAAADLPGAVTEADIVSCATLSAEPIIHGEWLRPGTHLDLIGSFKPDMRESDEETVRRASVFVDTEEAVSTSGDLCGLGIEPLGTLAALCAGTVAGRRSAAELTLFKSVGYALEDLVAAELVAARISLEI